MYGNHPYGTLHKRDIPRGKSMSHGWRTTDGKTYPVTTRKVGKK